ncbi:hypothetical protein [Acuticoccus yangtzensis]|uniref:hypothetical protein n=1 Tax=Acuticoccus yangtzensis TaxID=1443441 RepID=UPI000A4DBCB2|nr:hypothetical protein [Acuticoccus yangtzensis]
MNLLYDDLPSDPELAFLYLADAYIDAIPSVNKANVTILLVKLKQASSVLNLEITDLPDYVDMGDGFTATFDRIILACERLKIQKSMTRDDKVISPSDKEKIISLLEKIRRLIEVSSASEEKKSLVIEKIISLQAEIMHDNIRWDRINEKFIRVAGTASALGTAFEPIMKQISKLAQYLGIVQRSAKETSLLDFAERLLLPSPDETTAEKKDENDG